jgi:NAD(P)-dependent dehydrogenase (short-subunit alcohol dehydrogenase family)
MTTPQRPIQSGFGAATTASEAIDGVDLTGKTAIVTGGYSGLGLEITRALLNAGAHVIVPARRPAHARTTFVESGDEFDTVEVDEIDLADLADVAAFANRFLNSDRKLDLLINDAAIMANPERHVGPGWESQFATNHLGHYVLANLLWPALAADGGARVIAMSSTGHKLSPIRFHDPHFTSGYDKWKAYGQAKTANSLFAVQLDQLGKSSGVRAFAAHPGGIMTPLQRHLPREEMIASGWMDENGVVSDRFKSPAQGAATAVWAATSKALDGMGGVYLEDVDIAWPTDPDSPNARFAGVDAHAIDPEDAGRLWTLSAELTGVNVFSQRNAVGSA